MALLSNINDKFAVDSTGAIQFNGQVGTSGYVLKSNANAAPTWVDPSTVIGGPYLPLSGGTLTGATATATGISFTVGGTLSANGGINGLTLANGGINGSNYNIAGVNQLTIADPGEGIVFTGTTTLTLAVIDDTVDDKLKLTNATQLDLNSTARITNLLDPSSAQDAATKAYVDSVTPGVGPFLPLTGGTLTGALAGTSANFSGIVYSSGGFRTGSTNSSYNLLTRDNNNGSYPLYCQNSLGVSGDAAIARFAYGSYGANTGTAVLDVRSGTSYFNDCNLGIGNTSPDYSLDIKKSSSTSSSATGTTMQRLWNYVGADLSQQKTFIDFVFQDDNDNEYPQVRIGAEVGQNGDANSTIKEGSGAFVVYTNNATGSTPGTNSLTERMRVDYAGNVGIGATSPLRKLHVVGQLAVNNATTEYYGVLMSGGEGADPSVLIGDWHNSSGTIKWDSTGNYLRIDSQHSTANAAILFSGNDGSTEYMRIASTGNVGIGTTSPDTKLHVHSTSGDGKLRVSGDNIENSGGEIKGFNNGFAFNVAPSGGGTYVERMRINGSGNVGIGTTGPVNKLGIEVAANSNTKAINIYSKNTSPNSYTSIGSQYSISNTYVESEIRFGNETQNGGGSYLGFVAGGTNSGNTEKMRITSGGNVGIGTTSPAAGSQLTLRSSASTGMTILSASNTGECFINFSDNDDPNVGQIFYGHSPDKMILRVGDDSRITILGSNGRVGIGENSPADKLDVNGAILCNNRVQIDGVDDAGNVTGSEDSLRATGYGLMGNRTGQIYITNGNSAAGAKIVFGVRGAHNANNKLVIGDTLSYFNNNKLLVNKTVDDGGQLQVASSTTSGSIRIGGGNGVGQSRVYIESNGNDSYIDSFGGSAYQNLAIQAAVIKLQTTTSPSRRVDLGTQTWAGYGSNPIARLNIEVNGGSALNIFNTAENDAYLRFIDSQSNGSQYAYFAFNSSTNYFTINNMGNNAITLKNNGYVGINNTDPTYRLHVKNSNNVSIFEDTSNASGAAFIVFNRPGVFSMGSITRNGSANSVSYNTGSDYRLKEDLKDFNALDLVNNITAYDYKWKDVDQRDYGFIAHELSQTLPNVVTGKKDGEKMQGVDYSKLTPILLKAIQELEARVKELENK